MRQIYYPIPGRELVMPKMFEEDQLEVREKQRDFIGLVFPLESLRKRRL